MNKPNDSVLKLENYIRRFRNAEGHQRQASEGQKFARSSFSNDSRSDVNEGLLRQTVQEVLSPEEILLKRILDERRVKSTRNTIRNENRQFIVDEVLEAVLIDSETGVPHEVTETRATMLSDGQPSKGEVAICRCGGMIHVSSRRICPGCRAAVCIRRECTKTRRGDQFFCGGFCWARWFFLGTA